MFENTILDVGLDVHKNTTAVATANGRSNGKVSFYSNGLSGRSLMGDTCPATCLLGVVFNED